MDISTRIAAGNLVRVTAVGSDSVCVQLCQQEPRRLMLILSISDPALKAQVQPPGLNIDVNIPLPAGMVLPLATSLGGTMILTLGDHGPLVQMAWWSDINLTLSPGIWSVTEVIDLQLPCKVNTPATTPVDISCLSAGRGGDDTFSLGLWGVSDGL